MQWNAIQWSPIQRNVIQCRTMQYNTIKCNTIISLWLLFQIPVNLLLISYGLEKSLFENIYLFIYAFNFFSHCCIPGDLAILLKCGMPMKWALFFNALSGVTSFAGLYIGIPASSTEGAQQWILGITAGMFIYIALVDMVRTHFVLLFLLDNDNSSDFLCTKKYLK